MTLVVIAYHYVQPSYAYPFQKGIVGMTCDEFSHQIEMLSQLGSFISAGDMLHALSDQDVYGDRPKFLLTFDDGLQDHWNYVLPIIDSMSVPAVFFANTQSAEQKTLVMVHKLHFLLSNHSEEKIWGLLEKEVYNKLHIKIHLFSKNQLVNRYGSDKVKQIKYLINFQMNYSAASHIIDQVYRKLDDTDEAHHACAHYMSWDQLTVLHERGYLGSHGHQHCNYAKLSPAEVEADIAKAATLFEKHTGSTPPTFAYPYGLPSSCPPWSAPLLAQYQHKAAFSMMKGVHRSIDNPYMIRRIDCNDAPGGKDYNPEWFRLCMAGHIPDS